MASLQEMRALVTAVAILFISTTHGRDDSREPLDTLIFSNATNVADHKVQLRNAAIVAGPGATLGEPHAAQIAYAKPGGAILFELEVSPLEQNHITVKFWGGKVAADQTDTWMLDPATNFTVQYGSSHAWPCELDQALMECVCLPVNMVVRLGTHCGEAA